MPFTLLRGMVCAGVLVLAVGCGSGQLPTYPVSGKVIYRDGRPLPGGTLELRSRRPEAANLNARATIAADGTFELGTYRPEDGAVEGEHDAIVVPASSLDPLADERPVKRPTVNARFRNYGKSGLSVTVRPERNTITLTVEP